MPQVQQVGGGHPLVRLEPFEDRIATVLQLPDGDGGLQGKQRRCRQLARLHRLLQRLEISLAGVGPELLEAAQAEDETLPRGLGNGREGNRKLLLLLNQNTGSQPLPIKEGAIGIGEQRLHQQPLGVGGDAGVDGGHSTPGDDRVAARSAENHRLTDGKAARKHRRDLNAGFKLRVLGQAGEDLALLNHVPHLHIHVRDCAGGGRRQIGVIQLDLGRDVFGAVAIQLHL